MVTLIDHSETDLAELIQSDFGRQVDRAKLSRELIDWFHYRARCIACRPRLVTISESVKAEASRHPAIREIAAALRFGADLKPWLSDRIRTRKADHRADLMFCDWQISHFHLSQLYDRPDRISRTQPLLFAYVNNAEAVLLRVGDHRSWTEQSTLRELLQTRPAIMEQWEANSILPSAKGLSDKEHANRRANGYSAMVNLDGRHFMPSLGIAGSQHAVRLNLKTIHFLRALQKLRQDIEGGTTVRETRSRLAYPIGVPVRLRVRLENNGDLTVYDAERRWGFFSEAAPV